jgi:hypothetical protein
MTIRIDMQYENKPYVYKITHMLTEEYYIGYRMANTKSAKLDLGTVYKTSSKIIKDLGFDNFKKEIVAEFYNVNRDDAGLEAWVYEQQLIKSYFQDSLCLNRHYQNVENSKEYFRTSGPLSEDIKIKMSKPRANKENMRLSDERKAKLREFLTGRPKSEEHKAKLKKPKSEERKALKR